jgi:hypothetical protein
MYIKKGYSAERYIKIRDEISPRLDDLDLDDDFMHIEEKRKLLLDLGIEKIQSGTGTTKTRNKSDPATYLRVALLAVKIQVKNYLRLNKNKFEQDVESGVLERYCIGVQMDFPETGAIYTRPKILQDEIIAVDSRAIFAYKNG